MNGTSSQLASINAAANHQPVLMPIAQHGSVDDMVYFTCSSGGNANNNNANNNVSVCCRSLKERGYVLMVVYS
jgi:hypothetical protein